MKSKIYLFLITISVFNFISCRKQNDNINPTITLISPKENDTLANSEKEYTIQFQAKDETGLLKEKLKVSDQSGVVLTSEERDLNGTVYSYKNSFIFGGTAGSLKSLFLEIEIEDEAHNRLTKRISFFVKL
jgi:hypothetical protein